MARKLNGAADLRYVLRGINRRSRVVSCLAYLESQNIRSVFLRGIENAIEVANDTGLDVKTWGMVMAALFGFVASGFPAVAAAERKFEPPR